MSDTGMHPGWFIGAVVTAVSGILLWWGNNRYFAGRFDQWQADVKERIEKLSARIDGIEEMKQQIKTFDIEIARNRDIKHDVIGMQKAFQALMDLLRHKL